MWRSTFFVYVHVSKHITAKRVYLGPGLGEAENIKMWRCTFYVYVHCSNAITATRVYLNSDLGVAE